MVDVLGHGEGLVDQRGVPGRVDGGQPLGDRGYLVAIPPLAGGGSGLGEGLVDQRGGPGRVDGGQPLRRPRPAPLVVPARVRAWSISAAARVGSMAASRSAIAASAPARRPVVGDGVGHGEGLVDQRRVRGVDGGQPLGDRGQRLAALPVAGDGFGHGEGLIEQKADVGPVSDGGQDRWDGLLGVRMLAGLGDRSDGIAHQRHGHEQGDGKPADQGPDVGREQPGPHGVVDGVGCLGEGGVAVVVQPGEEGRVRTGGNQECAAPSEGRQSLEPVPGTGGHQVVGKPLRPVPGERAGAAVGTKA